MKRLVLPLVFSLLAPLVHADRRDDGPRPDDRRGGPRVILYEHADYRGEGIELRPGDRIEDLSRAIPGGGGRLNDAISSIRVENGAVAYVYENAHFRGAVLRLTESARDLSGRPLPDNPRASWNDRISSIRVELARRGDDRREAPEVVLKRVYLEVLAREPRPDELQRGRGWIIDQGWTDDMLRDELRRGDEFRREGADRIVRRAYREVLDREPDAGGLTQYRRAVLERGWTEGDVRDDLRRSEEYRRKHGGR
ncbi:MAG TPA: peptidase inhibitor family I36 protein [Lacunisphaera sp.]|nr:peptidase inhibitor family I36 protein [Lacunisphaera sp.]